GAGACKPHAAELLADQLEAVEHGRRRDDRSAVLVVMKHRDIHALPQRTLDVEAFRRLDVLEVYAAESRLETGDDIDEFLRVALVDLDVEHVDVGKFLEQAALSLHHRLAGERAYVAEAENRGTIGDDRHQIAARGERRRLVRIVLDGEAGIR